MSLPNADREMLLSAALDGALSVQEQAEFDRAIASDPTFAAEFEELQSLRADLRQCLAPLRQQRMPAGATDRIVAAALAAADGVAAPEVDAPVRPYTPSGVGKIAAAALALAAAALLAVTLWNRPDDAPLAVEDGPAPLEAVAQSDTVDKSVENPPAMAAVTEPPQASPGGGDLQALAANGNAVAVEPDPSKPKVMSIKPAPAAAPSPESVANLTERPGTPPTPADPLSPKSEPAAGARMPLQVVLVLAVELTQTGRDQLALQEALRATDIRLGQDSVMGSNVVAHLQQANVIDAGTSGDSQAGKLYFIEASAKRIDRLMTYLMSNKESFASVGLSLADQPPLLAAVGDLREVDPTKVRQDNMTGVARDLMAPGGKPLSIDPNHAFLPLSRELVNSGLLPAAAPIPNGSANATDDFPSQLLLFVK
ncbi:MAG: anti-sigma factor family protein [Planctomycetaceae bacterium]